MGRKIAAEAFIVAFFTALPVAVFAGADLFIAIKPRATTEQRVA